MIRFSKMADYGVLLLGHFVRHAGELASSNALAEAYHMPRPVVANLLKEFCKGGLLESKRGLHGGYRLALPAESITLLQVLAVIDGPVQLTDCAAERVVDFCDYTDVCPSRSPMRAVNQRIVQFLDSLTLAELLSDVPVEPLSAAALFAGAATPSVDSSSTSLDS